MIVISALVHTYIPIQCQFFNSASLKFTNSEEKAR
jgi:hypothetical protein